ncbi:hypothetical protein OIU84_024486 [Salix udensis]|uniref:Uncharacterized protein n=1 Tax=Salix udensis TaxID=889485 RepID=A0AAD6KHD4_9ROSI|nr:hypothetical protein OIU84_024486 [Salix udensis]
MDTKFQALPPLKRHRLLQQQQQQENKENVPIALQLPAKKRKESRNPLLADAAPQVTTTAAYCLPTKKRVWALHPDLVSGGALKPTTTKGGEGSWAHVVCALLIPEVFFEDPDGREGIHCSKVPKRRWEGKCYVWKKKKETIVAGFCKSHTELWDKQQQSGKFKIVAREEHRK